ncbi:hypothetical protein TOPH_01939 [Tolypocladium ophioglossoides CBS 100239]|uniref:Uncharacterized protein n=1 Tax=Tolypocladium ophioglossoides (strain CBS 100239) TaxID=1163406 RepID=A0A0L0NHI3_TOLOC|nr:hypothetical protein TOPH_01939 [Tolypocladium ophioglossoides CBS 100239]
MSCPESITATLSMDDITTLSDAQLVRLLEEHRCPNGHFELPVDGWERLTREERNHLAERLRRAQECVLAQNPAACSRPLDLDQVNARLAEVSDGGTTASPARPRDTPKGPGHTPPYTEEEERADRRDEETEAYRDLVNDGGRPLYPISLLEQVLRDPEEYRKMLWPLWEHFPTHSTPWLVYQKQLKRWQDFRNWQNDNRGLEDDDDGFSTYVERRKRGCIKLGYAKKLAEIKSDPECLRSDWEEYEHYMRRWQRRWQREPDCSEFSDYVDAIKRQWRALKARQAAEAEAERVFFLTQEDPHRLSIPEPKRIRMLRAATKELVAAKDEYKSAKRRGDLVTNFIRATFDYNDAKKDTARHAVLAQWVLQQIPLIEAELTQPNMTEVGSDITTSRKRRHTCDEDNSGMQSPKKQKPDHGALGFLSGRSVAVLAHERETPTPAPLAIPSNRPRPREAVQGSRPKSPARRSLRSMDERRGGSLGNGVERNTQRPKRVEEPSTAGQKCDDGQRQTGKRRRADVLPTDGTPMMRSKDDNVQTKSSAKAGTQDANLRTKGGQKQLLKGPLNKETKRSLTDEDHSGKRGSKRQKLKPRELSSLSGSRPVPAEAGEKMTEADSAIDQCEIQGPGTDTAPGGRAARPVNASQAINQGPRRSARLAARQATSGTGVALQTRPGLRPSYT